MKNFVRFAVAAVLLAFSVAAGAQIKAYSMWEPQDGVTGGTTPAYEVGSKMYFHVPGNITGLRFYKSSTNTGTHVGRIWNASNGAQLASVTFTGETASGWQTMLLATPLAVAPYTNIIVSYNWAPNSNTAQIANYYANGDVCLGVVCTSKGRFSTSGTSGVFPANENTYTYFADVLFEPSGPLGQNWTGYGKSPIGTLTTRTESNSYELGIRFTPTVAGFVTAIRVYKLAGANATHQVTLWDVATGTMMATQWSQFSGGNDVEPASGWVTTMLDEPVLLTPGKTYSVSWHRNGVEPFAQYTKTYPFTVGPLTINGQYHTTTSAIVMPATNSGTLWYAADVVFQPVFGGLFK